jgi:hypothetical protein
MAQPTPVRGRVLEIASADSAARDWIYEAMQRPDIHVPLGLRAAPERAQFDRDSLTLVRGAEVRDEAVRYHVLRSLDGEPRGFFVDFGWDHPNDSVREIDLAFPDVEHRGLDSYFDAIIILAQYFFSNGLAKRYRWRVESPSGEEPKRGRRQGGRLVTRQEERHPVTGEWRTTYIYEFAVADFERIGERLDIDPYVDYAKQGVSLWRALASY